MNEEELHLFSEHQKEFTGKIKKLNKLKKNQKLIDRTREFLGKCIEDLPDTWVLRESRKHCREKLARNTTRAHAIINAKQEALKGNKTFLPLSPEDRATRMANITKNAHKEPEYIQKLKYTDL